MEPEQEKGPVQEREREQGQTRVVAQVLELAPELVQEPARALVRELAPGLVQVQEWAPERELGLELELELARALVPVRVLAKVVKATPRRLVWNRRHLRLHLRALVRPACPACLARLACLACLAWCPVVLVPCPFHVLCRPCVACPPFPASLRRRG
jgi:hypothetical protein